MKCSICSAPLALLGGTESPAASARSQIFSPKYSPKTSSESLRNPQYWLKSCCGKGVENPTSPQQTPEELRMTPKQLRRLREQRDFFAAAAAEEEEESEEELVEAVFPDDTERNPYVLPVFCIKDEQSRIPLHLLCLNDQVTPKLLEVILEPWPKSLNVKDASGNTCMHLLCSNRAVTSNLLKTLLASMTRLAESNVATGIKVPLFHTISSLRLAPPSAYCFLPVLLIPFHSDFTASLQHNLPDSVSRMYPFHSLFSPPCAPSIFSPFFIVCKCHMNQ